MFPAHQIRSRTNGARSLDDALRALKKRSWDVTPSASYYLQGRGYTEDDVEAAVSEAAGADMKDWFGRYVASTEELPFKATLAKVGVVLSVSTDREGKKRYVLELDPNASAEVARVREGWLSDRNPIERQ